jgi:hypothetical protein
MTITFPRDMPADVEAMSFDLARFVAQPGPKSPVVEYADPMWTAEVESVILSPVRLAAWRAWWTSLRGGGYECLMWDAKAPYPVVYPNGFAGLTRATGGSFAAGTATVTALAAFTCSLSNLPADFVLSEGDKIGFVKSGYRSLHVIQESATASGTGTVSLTLEPAVPLSLIALPSVAAELARPKVKMRVRPDSWSNPTRTRGERIGYSAYQAGY